MDMITGIAAFNWLDICVILILVIVMGRGLWTGFSMAVSTFFGVILGFWVAAQQFPFVSMKLSPFIHDDVWRSLISFTLLFLVVYLTFLIAGIVLRGFFRVIKLGWIDRLLGGIVGFAKGLIFTGVIIFVMTLVLPENSPVLRKSVLYPRMSRIAQTLNNLAPDNLKGKFMWKWRKIEKDRKLRKHGTQGKIQRAVL